MSKITREEMQRRLDVLAHVKTHGFNGINMQTLKPTKWMKEYIIQEYTCCGWEDSTSEESYRAAIVQKKTYISNGVQARIITRRALNPNFS